MADGKVFKRPVFNPDIVKQAVNNRIQSSSKTQTSDTTDEFMMTHNVHQALNVIVNFLNENNDVNQLQPKNHLPVNGSDQLNMTLDDVCAYLESLNEISRYEVSNNPKVFLSYDYDSYRSGSFTVNEITDLCSYVVLLVLDHKHYVSDVLGKHSEIEIDHLDLEVSPAVNGETVSDNSHELYIDEKIPDTNNGEELYARLSKWMSTLPELPSDKFFNEYYEDIEIKAHDFLKDIRLTSNIILNVYLPTIPELVDTSFINHRMKLSEYIIIRVLSDNNRPVIAHYTYKEGFILIRNKHVELDDIKFGELAFTACSSMRYYNDLTDTLPHDFFYDRNSRVKLSEIDQLTEYVECLIDQILDRDEPVKVFDNLIINLDHILETVKTEQQQAIITLCNFMDRKNKSIILSDSIFRSTSSNQHREIL